MAGEAMQRARMYATACAATSGLAPIEAKMAGHCRHSSTDSPQPQAGQASECCQCRYITRHQALRAAMEGEVLEVCEACQLPARSVPCAIQILTLVIFITAPAISCQEQLGEVVECCHAAENSLPLLPAGLLTQEMTDSSHSCGSCGHVAAAAAANGSLVYSSISCCKAGSCARRDSSGTGLSPAP